MTGTETEQMCRLVVRGPSRQIEVAVPVGVVVAPVWDAAAGVGDSQPGDVAVAPGVDPYRAVGRGV
ncbi:hypothetical protein, partial [Micromonospora wenchangensis]|uniref:hypothetical protein n=1 Tax=Micromonospora wenchangensis TaxID=1185415 RepID=UPI00343605B6